MQTNPSRRLIQHRTVTIYGTDSYALKLDARKSSWRRDKQAALTFFVPFFPMPPRAFLPQPRAFRENRTIKKFEKWA
jgi:hypothetical protein